MIELVVHDETAILLKLWCVPAGNGNQTQDSLIGSEIDFPEKSEVIHSAACAPVLEHTESITIR